MYFFFLQNFPKTVYSGEFSLGMVTYSSWIEYLVKRYLNKSQLVEFLSEQYHIPFFVDPEKEL